MSKQFFIGDTHYGHNGVARKFRKVFSTDEEHHETIHQNIMDVSGKRNTLFLMGDNIFKTSHFGKLDEYSENFEKVFLCLGNHDHIGLARYSSQFDNVYTFGIIKKYGLWLSHAPIHEQELFGKNNVHGHVHENTVPDDRYLNVSCEAIDYKPISLEQIRDIFAKRNT